MLKGFKVIKSILKASVASLILTVTLQAEERAITMKTMLDGMNLIQLGFLTNTEVMIEQGIFEIKTSTDILTNVKHVGPPSLREARGHACSKKNVQELTTHANELLKQFKDGNITTALREYNSIVLQCVECHNTLRNYKDRGHRFR